MRVPTVAGLVAAVEHLAGSVEWAGAGRVRAPRAEALTRDLLRVAYRLAFCGLAGELGGAITRADAVALLELETLRPDALDRGALERASTLLIDGAADVDDVPTALGDLHQAVLDLTLMTRDGRPRLTAAGARRKAAGAYFTPPSLVGWLLDQVLEPALDVADDPSRVTVCDPACGSGLFLVAAARRLRLRGVPAEDAVTRCVSGVDSDPVAVELARTCLWLELVEPGRPVRLPGLRLRTADALLEVDWDAFAPVGGFDAVVGNPPFLNQLERLTAHDPQTARALDVRSGGLLGPYTDLSAVFLQRAVDWVRPGGRVGLVQPQSVLAARDAGGVRRYLAGSCALEALWASDEPVFDVSLATCAPVLRRGAEQQEVRRWHGPSFRPLPAQGRPDLSAEWSFLLAAGLGFPEVVLDHGAGQVGDLAECTADFRDQYYGLADYVHEATELPDGAPLVTTGLIEPARCLWGERETRYLKRRWRAPVVDLAALRAEPPLARWAAARLVPKLLVATQGRVVEAVADEAGRLLPSVPTITVAAPPDRLWHLLAVLLAPPVAVHAATTYAGTGLTMRAIKLSAKQVARLPLPGDRRLWDEGAALAQRAQEGPGDAADRDVRLRELGEVMCGAYGVTTQVMAWWCAGFKP